MPKYQSELVEYGAGAFVACFEEVTRVLTERGVDVTLTILLS